MKRNVTIAAAIVLVAAARASAAAPFAMVTDLKGEAWSMEGTEPRKLGMLAYIEKPTHIRVDPAAKVVVTYFANGLQYSIAGPARVSVETPTPNMIEGQMGESRKITPDKSIGGGLSPEQWRRLQQATVVMRAVRSKFSVVGPDKTVVLTQEPEFEWTTLPNAKGYRLVVYTVHNSVIHESTTEHNIVRPGAALALKAGASYRWKVDALGVSKPVSTFGSFEVADSAVREQMLTLKATAGSDAAARAFYATTLEANGHMHDARVEWRALARDYPDQTEFRQRAR
jgi:hypothetical protein